MTPPLPPPAGPDEELMTTKEVAEVLRLRVGTLRRWRREGKGPPTFRLGSRLYCYRTELREWMKAEEAGSRREAS